MAVPPKGRAAAYSIAAADVIDLAGKIRRDQRAPQHLSDCLREHEGCGQFVSAGREANRTTASA
jgi:hypothetical protein